MAEIDTRAVVAAERIFEDVPLPRSNRSRKILRFAVGQVVPGPERDRLNVDDQGRQTKVPSAETDAVAGVPERARTAKKAPARKAPAKKAPAKKRASR